MRKFMIAGIAGFFMIIMVVGVQVLDVLNTYAVNHNVETQIAINGLIDGGVK